MKICDSDGNIRGALLRKVKHDCLTRPEVVIFVVCMNIPAALFLSLTLRMASAIQPTYFISHGGGPMPFTNDPGHKPIVAHWKKLSDTISRPKAILVVSAHWEESKATVTTSVNPTLLYDYYGFPPETYKVTTRG